MATYLAFLRAINLGATRKFPKAAIIAATEAAGFTDVETYINTGNVRLRLDAAVAGAGSRRRWRRRSRRPRLRGPDHRVHPEGADRDRGRGGILRARGQALRVAAQGRADRGAGRGVEAAGSADEVARVGGRAVHLLLGQNYHKAKLTNAVVEKHLGVATNRNLTVIRALAEKWG